MSRTRNASPNAAVRDAAAATAVPTAEPQAAEPPPLDVRLLAVLRAAHTKCAAEDAANAAANLKDEVRPRALTAELAACHDALLVAVINSDTDTDGEVAA